MSKVLLVEPFYSGSHKSWADQLIYYSQHQIDLISLKGKFWKWRMHGAAIELVKKIEGSYDLLLVSSMIDLSLFKSLLPKENRDKPILLYFHENQLAYPWTEKKKDWDRSYAWKNYTSCLVADRICFNSQYNMESFLSALPNFLLAFPDYQNLATIDTISKKSQVLSIGMELSSLQRKTAKNRNKPAVILWNHRWEHDKGPELFFRTLIRLKEENVDFKLIVLGESYPNKPDIFDLAFANLSSRILHWGFAESRDEYIKYLWMADILPVTSKHDFFGISVLEAIYCETIPLLPNKLVYPEHFKDSTVFYQSESEFYDQLKSLLQSELTFDMTLKKSIEKYDWKNMFLQYDDLISQLTK